MTEEKRDTLQNILTEKELLDLTGLTKAQLADCRTNKQLPFLKVNRNSRLYLESDVVTWLKCTRTVLNSALKDANSGLNSPEID